MKFLRLALLLILAVSAASAREKSEEKARSLLKEAADHSLLHLDGISSVQLKFAFAVHGSKSQQAEGSYSLLVSPAGDWRKDVDLATYADLEVGRGTSIWRKRNLDYIPLPLFWLNAIFANHEYLNNTDDEVEKYFTTSEHHVELRCVDLRRDKKPFTLCFDPQANLARADIKELDTTYEYSDYRPVGQKFVPYKIVVKRGGDVFLDGQMESADANPKIDQHLLDPPSGAAQQPGCFLPVLAKNSRKIPPHYPEVARRGWQQGTVTMYALIKSDGAVQNPRVIRTAGSELDKASLESIQQWRYEPAKCGDVLVDSEIPVSINFSLH